MTFGLFGNSPEYTMNSLGVKPVDLTLTTSNSDFKVVRVNKNHSGIYKILKAYDQVGILSESSRGSGKVLQRDTERSYLLRYENPVQVKSKYEDHPLLIDLVVVKKWSTSCDDLPMREMKKLEEVDCHQLQEPTTIPIYLAKDREEGDFQLFKIREPIVRFNDLHRLLGDEKHKKEIFSKYSKECLRNWANLARRGYIQTAMLKLDHHSEDWVHDAEGDIPGNITTGINSPCNAGFIKHDGDVKCIINDFEHVYKKDEIFDLPNPHGEPDYGNMMTCKIGTVVASLFTMLSRTGDLLRLPADYVAKIANIALVDCYNVFYERAREEGFELVRGGVEEVFEFSKRGYIRPRDISKICDQFYAPLLFEDSLDYWFDGILNEKIKEEVLEDFTRGAEISWFDADETMTNIIDLVLSYTDDRVPDESHKLSENPQKVVQEVLYRMAKLVKSDHKKAKELSYTILGREPEDIDELRTILDIDAGPNHFSRL